MKRAQVMGAIEAALRGRRIVWAGLRADDIQGLHGLLDMVSSFSLLGPTVRQRDPRSLALDEMSGRRVDPETWDIDAHQDDTVVRRFREGLLEALSSPTVLMPYRSSEFLSSVQLVRRSSCEMLGLFGGQQALFDYKPWIEVAVAKAGIAHVPWRYVAAEDRGRLRDIPDGDYLVRKSRTSGGEGVFRISSMTELMDNWPASPDRLVGLSPFIESVPVNVGATVWRDGVTVHNPSVQLIGIPACVSREFGHCGNDFAAVSQFPNSVIDEIERSTVTIGSWLRSQGYLGSFGVDYLVSEREALFAEVNPRFQGSTRTSSRIDSAMGLPCLFLEHLAAWLGASCFGGPNLRERVTAAEPMASVVVHWTGADPRRLDAGQLTRRVQSAIPGVITDVVTSPHVINDPGSTVVRLTLPRSVTKSGFELDANLVAAIDDWRSKQLDRPVGKGDSGEIPTKA